MTGQPDLMPEKEESPQITEQQIVEDIYQIHKKICALLEISTVGPLYPVKRIVNTALSYVGLNTDSSGALVAQIENKFGCSDVKPPRNLTRERIEEYSGEVAFTIIEEIFRKIQVIDSSSLPYEKKAKLKGGFRNLRKHISESFYNVPTTYSELQSNYIERIKNFNEIIRTRQKVIAACRNFLSTENTDPINLAGISLLFSASSTPLLDLKNVYGEDVLIDEFGVNIFEDIFEGYAVWNERLARLEQKLQKDLDAQIELIDKYALKPEDLRKIKTLVIKINTPTAEEIHTVEA